MTPLGELPELPRRRAVVEEVTLGTVLAELARALRHAEVYGTGYVRLDLSASGALSLEAVDPTLVTVRTP